VEVAAAQRDAVAAAPGGKPEQSADSHGGSALGGAGGGESELGGGEG